MATPTLLRRALLAGAALAVSGVLTLAAAVGLGGRAAPVDRPVSAQRAATVADLAASGDLGVLVRGLQERLRRTPRDHRSWSALGLAYVEQARVTADPTYYPRAERAVDRAARLAPGDSVMLTARATLQAARHDFRGALASAEAALAANPYAAQAAAVRADALTELGRYDEALRAARRADDLDPGTSTFARLSYQAELRGDLPTAARLMRQALEAAGRSASSYAFAAFHLGELARTRHRVADADRWYRASLGADPTYVPALAGLARLAVARGDLTTAVHDYRRVVVRLPLTEYVVELGELFEATGRMVPARRQFAVATASARLLAANGVATDLETALFEADHGSPARALAAARAEWGRRHSIHVADALAWALHVNGRDRDAVRYARLATRLGTRDPRMLFHLGAVEAALGLPGADGTLREARRLDGGASPFREGAIATLLRGTR